MRLCLQRCVAPLAVLLLSGGVSLRADISLPGSVSPQADEAQVQVRRGQSVTILLRGHYGGAGTLSFLIVKNPQHGKLSALRLLSDNRATILYENEGAEAAAADGFAYVVKGGGGVSSPAEVRIAVEEAPAKMQVPAKLEFGSIMAGASAIRQLRITNEGGGVLAGRLTASAPWKLGLSEYQVGAGRTENVPVIFQPNEARGFVGQLTLAGPGGETSTVALEGAASSPLAVKPAQLQLGPAGNEPRAGSLALTNRTARPLHLKVEAGPSIRPVDDLVLAPGAKQQIEIVIRSGPETPVHEQIALVGEGFRLPVAIDAEAKLPAREATPEPVRVAAQPPPVRSLTTPTPAPAPRVALVQGVVAPAASPSLGEPYVAVRAQRLTSSRWELRWKLPSRPVAKYQVDERFLSLDEAGELQTNWQRVSAPEFATTGDSVSAQISGLAPKQLHMLRLTALDAKGATLWETPLIALAPPPQSATAGRGWLVIFAIALVVFLALRWRAARSVS